MKLLLASEFPNVFNRAKHLFPKSDKNLVTIINTASIGEGFELDYDSEIKPFEDLCYDVELFDLSSRGGVIEQLEKSDIFYVAGGNTFFLLEHMNKSGFKKCLSNDFLYIGSSAGSVIMSPDINFISPMDEKEKANLDSTKGLNQIWFAFLPHIGHETMGDAAKEIQKNYKADVPY